MRDYNRYKFQNITSSLREHLTANRKRKYKYSVLLIIEIHEKTKSRKAGFRPRDKRPRAEHVSDLSEASAERSDPKIGWSGAERSGDRAWEKTMERSGARSAEREVAERERSVELAELADHSHSPLKRN